MIIQVLFLIALVALCTVLFVRKMYTHILVVTVCAGVLQGIVEAFPLAGFLFLADDCSVTSIFLLTIIYSIRNQDRKYKYIELLLVIFILYLFLEVFRSPMSQATFAQARQVVFPISLIYVGFRLNKQIDWYLLSKVIVGLALAVSAWCYYEAIIQYPILVPLENSGSKEILRNGLTSNYYADGIIPGKGWFRPGGPFLNPPVLGYFLALAFICSYWIAQKKIQIISQFIFASIIIITVSKSGILILFFCTIAYFISIKLNKLVSTLLILTIVFIGGLFFSGQGGSSNHVDGLGQLVFLGLSTGIGIGFDVIGYQTTVVNTQLQIGESYLGLVIAWIGIPALLLFIFIIFKLTKNLQFSTFLVPAQAKFWAIGFFISTAVSESASSISGTAISWVLLGFVLSLGEKETLLPNKGNKLVNKIATLFRNIQFALVKAIEK